MYENEHTREVLLDFAAYGCTGYALRTGGEIAAMAVADSVCRLVPGVLADEQCYTGESHWDGLLEYPQYTRPAVFRGMEVPEVLLSGHHANIAAWRRAMALQKTQQMRPELLGAHGRRGGREG